MYVNTHCKCFYLKSIPIFYLLHNISLVFMYKVQQPSVYIWLRSMLVLLSSKYANNTCKQIYKHELVYISVFYNPRCKQWIVKIMYVFSYRFPFKEITGTSKNECACNVLHSGRNALEGMFLIAQQMFKHSSAKMDVIIFIFWNTCVVRCDHVSYIPVRFLIS